MVGLVGSNGESLVKKAPAVKGIRPFGSKIYAEEIPAEETIQTTLVVQDAKYAGAPQAYVLGVGPTFPKDLGIEVGSRIFFHGKVCVVDDPANKDHKRTRMLLDLSNIIAIIDEDK